MKKFGKFCGITALILIILGIVFVVGGFAAGASLITLRNGVYEEGNYEHNGIFSLWKTLNKGSIGSGSKRVSSDSFDRDENIKSVLVDIRYGDVEICYGDEDGRNLKDGEILVEKRIYGNLQKFEVSADDGTLEIMEDYSGHDSLDSVDLWSDRRGEIKIYVSDNFSFDKVCIVNGTGDIYIDRDLNIGELSIEMGTGDFSSDYRVQVSESTHISKGTGDIDLENLICQGDVFVQNGAGDIGIQGEVNGNVTVNNGTGDINVSLRGDINSYNYDLSTGVGDVSVNDQSFEGIGQEVKQDKNPGGSMITVETGVGDIALDIN